MVCRSFARWFMALALVLTGTAVSSLSAQQFIRADANTNGAMNLDDVIYISAYLYSDGPAPMVLDSGDVNDNGAVELGDMVKLLEFVFLGGPFPPAPFPFPGTDPTANLFAPPVTPNISLSLPNLSVVPGTESIPVQLTLSSDTVIHALEVALTFDPAAVTLSSFEVANGILGIAGVEYIQQGLSNDPAEPYLWLAAVADFATPVVGQFIPAGMNLPVATTQATIPNSANAPQTTQISFAPEVSSPPKRNLVVLAGGDTRAPTTSGGVIDIEVIFIRGDSNHDCMLDVSDVIYTVAWLFQGGPAHVCEDSADTNNDGIINLADPIYFLNYLFQAGPAPSEPFPLPGLDPDNDALDCAVQSACAGS